MTLSLLPHLHAPYTVPLPTPPPEEENIPYKTAALIQQISPENGHIRNAEIIAQIVQHLLPNVSRTWN